MLAQCECDVEVGVICEDCYNSGKRLPDYTTKEDSEEPPW